MELWFDLDGTLADTLRNEKPWYEISDEEWVEIVKSAKGMVNLSALARLLHRAQKNGHTIGVVSWLPKTRTKEAETIEAKREWLAKRLPSVKWDAIDIVPNGTAKWDGRNGFLFDDNKKNRREWDKHNGNGTAFNYTEILVILKEL